MRISDWSSDVCSSDLTDESIRMPPEGKPLSPEEIGVLRAWIAQGAIWEQHWAFQPPTPRTPPAVKNMAWVKSPIEAFVLARLESQRSEERRDGKECVSTCRTRWSPYT